MKIAAPTYSEEACTKLAPAGWASHAFSDRCTFYRDDGVNKIGSEAQKSCEKITGYFFGYFLYLLKKIKTTPGKKCVKSTSCPKNYVFLRKSIIECVHTCKKF